MHTQAPGVPGVPDLSRTFNLSSEDLTPLSYKGPDNFKGSGRKSSTSSLTGPKQSPNIRHGTHKPAHNDSERFLDVFGVFRRPETFKL